MHWTCMGRIVNYLGTLRYFKSPAIESLDDLFVYSQGKADLEVKNNRHQTALLLAASQGHTELIELLVANSNTITYYL